MGEQSNEPRPRYSYTKTVDPRHEPVDGYDIEDAEAGLGVSRFRTIATVIDIIIARMIVNALNRESNTPTNH